MGARPPYASQFFFLPAGQQPTQSSRTGEAPRTSSTTHFPPARVPTYTLMPSPPLPSLLAVGLSNSIIAALFICLAHVLLKAAAAAQQQPSLPTPTPTQSVHPPPRAALEPFAQPAAAAASGQGEGALGGAQADGMSDDPLLKYVYGDASTPYPPAPVSMAPLSPAPSLPDPPLPTPGTAAVASPSPSSAGSLVKKRALGPPPSDASDPRGFQLVGQYANETEMFGGSIPDAGGLEGYDGAGAHYAPLFPASTSTPRTQ